MSASLHPPPLPRMVNLFDLVPQLRPPPPPPPPQPDGQMRKMVIEEVEAEMDDVLSSPSREEWPPIVRDGSSSSSSAGSQLGRGRGRKG